MARAITSDELIKLRANGRYSQLYLDIVKPATVYSARVNQTDFPDPITAITYDGGSGTLANIKPGMTVYIGSSAGAYDKGLCRVRKDPTATVLYLGETSEIDFADNDYLTIVDEFGLWAKHLAISGTTVYMDYDVAYSDQHKNCDPVPLLGPVAAVLWLTGASVNFSPTASGWVPGSSISSYSWTATGASATSNMLTAAPTITYNAAGTYRVDCTVTAANGKTKTAYRWVIVKSAASMPLKPVLHSCSGDFETGGWEYKVELSTGATLTDVRDRALCVLHAVDYYNGAQGSIGPVAGYENVIAIGWIAGETIRWNPEQGSVVFSVRGPQYWLDQIPSYPTGLMDTTSTPTDWVHMQSLTVDKALWHFATWRSTASQIIDVNLSGDTKRASALEANGDTSLYQQLVTICHESILAKPLCDRYGRMFVARDTQYLAQADRLSIPIVQTIEKTDWKDEIEIERRGTRPVSLVQASGVSFDGTTGTPLISKAPGVVLGRFGRTRTVDNLLLADQTECNLLSGMVYAKENNPYPIIPVSFAENNRMFDVTPPQYGQLSIAAGDTPRGITFSNQKILPRRIEFEHDPENGTLSTYIDFEAETIGVPGVTVVPPVVEGPDTNLPSFDPALPGFPVFPPGTIWFPPSVPSVPPSDPQTTCLTGSYATGPYPMWPDKSLLLSSDSEKLSALMYNHCYVRAGSVAYRSQLRIYGKVEYTAGGDVWQDLGNIVPSMLTIKGLDASQNVVLLGRCTSINYLGPGYETEYTFEFEPVSATEVHGWQIDMDAFDGGGGTFSKSFANPAFQGWYQVPPHPNYPTTYPRGYIGDYVAPYSGDPITSFYFGYSGSQLKARSHDDTSQVINIWAYSPVGIYTKVGATLRVKLIDKHGWGGAIGIKLGAEASPTPWKWIWNAFYDDSPGSYVTYTATTNGERVHAFCWHIDGSGPYESDGVTPKWDIIEDISLTGWTTGATAYRLRIARVNLYNVCAA